MPAVLAYCYRSDEECEGHAQATSHTSTVASGLLRSSLSVLVVYTRYSLIVLLRSRLPVVLTFGVAGAFLEARLDSFPDPARRLPLGELDYLYMCLECMYMCQKHS